MYFEDVIVGPARVSSAQSYPDPDEHVKTSMSILEVYLLGSREEYIDDFFTRIPPDVILRMRCLSSSVLYAVEAYMYRHWNVSGTLSRWFYNVRTFLIALEACDAIVSGGAAVAFFARQDYPDADLEIYIPIHGLLPMGRFLRRQGYAYQAAPGQHPFFDAAVLSHTAYITTHDPRRRNDPHYNPYTCTYHFVLPLDPEFREGKHIRLVSVLTDPVEYMLRNSKSSEFPNYDPYACTSTQQYNSWYNELSHRDTCGFAVSPHNIRRPDAGALPGYESQSCESSDLDKQVSGSRVLGRRRGSHIAKYKGAAQMGAKSRR